MAKTLEKERAQPEAIESALRQAYFGSSRPWESFYHFYREIVGNPYMDPAHLKMARFIADRRKRFRMLQACRGTFKSSMGAAAYAAWRIGKDYLEHGESTIRIFFASEVLSLAQRNVLWTKRILEWNVRYQHLAGIHRGRKDIDPPWGVQGLTSRYRIDSRIAEPTIMPIALGSEPTGFHCDLIICDDLQAYASSMSREQIEKVWEFYRLLFSILDETRRSELLILSTRWHYDDIYSRIEEQSKTAPEGAKFSVLKLPDLDRKGNPTFPSLLPQEKLAEKESQHGRYGYSCQFKLNPVPAEDRTFQEEWVKFVSPFQLRQRKLHVYTSGDFAWTETERASRKTDWTVIFTVAIDEQWNYIFLDWYREQSSKTSSVKELFRQHLTYGSMMSALQKFDRSQIGDTIDQYGYEIGKKIRLEWVSYPARQSKAARIENMQPLFEQQKVFILPNMGWFVTELLDFPRGKHDDGLDCLSNIVHVARPTAKTLFTEILNPIERRIRQLMAGTYDPEGRKEEWKRV